MGIAGGDVNDVMDETGLVSDDKHPSGPVDAMLLHGTEAVLELHIIPAGFAAYDIDNIVIHGLDVHKSASFRVSGASFSCGAQE